MIHHGGTEPAEKNLRALRILSRQLPGYSEILDREALAAC
jgi:hypothetical protein